MIHLKPAEIPGLLYFVGATSFTQLDLSCTTIDSSLQCQSVAKVTGLYVYCPMEQDVTQSAVWTAGDSTVLRHVAPGVFESVSPGDSFVAAAWQNLPSYGRPVSVFPGTAPLLTYEISGRVTAANGSGAIDGAAIQILDGLVAGRSAISGVPPAVLPGYSDFFAAGAGAYRLLGVPPATYRVRATKDGYITQERSVTVRSGTPPADAFRGEPVGRADEDVMRGAGYNLRSTRAAREE
jgi:hypothetical protein